MTDTDLCLNSCEDLLSGHAVTHAAKRNVARDLIDLLLTFGDMEIPAGDDGAGCDFPGPARPN